MPVDPRAEALTAAIARAKLKVLNGATLGVVEQADQAKFLISVHAKKSR